MNHFDQKFELFERFSEGKLSSAELDSFRNQLANDPEFAEMFDQYQTTVQGIRQFGRMRLKNELETIHNQWMLNPASKILSWRNAMISGISAVVIVASVLIYTNNSGKNGENTKQLAKIASLVNNPVENNNISQNSEGNLPSYDNSVQAGVYSNTTNQASPQNLPKPLAYNTHDQRSNVIPPPVKIVTTEQNAPLRNRDAGDFPQCKFGSDFRTGCIPFQVKFADSSTVINGSITQWFWEFGDGSTSTQKNPVHTYTKNGIFTVSLKVTTSLNFSTTIESTNYIISSIAPDVSFTANPLIVLLKNSTVKFTNNTKYETPGTIWDWNFGDASGTSVMRDPVYKFTDTGIFSVELIATNEFGCSDQFSRPVQVLNDPYVYIPNAFAPNGVNSIYKISCLGIKEFHLVIYNRQGEILYESDDYNSHGWNGESQFKRGELNPAGDYVCKINIIGLDGNPYVFKEIFTLIR